jgi:hypothetical protein
LVTSQFTVTPQLTFNAQRQQALTVNLFSEADDGFRCGFEYENQRITENVTENVTENRSGLILLDLDN